MKSLIKIWKGEAPLYIAFWGVGAVGFGIIALVELAVVPLLLRHVSNGAKTASFMQGILCLIIYISWFTAVVQCFKNSHYKIERFFVTTALFISGLWFVGVLLGMVSYL